jgi:hypothetical protein
MSGMGCRHRVWTKELDDELLDGVNKGKNFMQLSNLLKMSTVRILNRLKEMGFDGLLDARKVMSGK